jgi:hypothetical protein
LHVPLFLPSLLTLTNSEDATLVLTFFTHATPHNPNIIAYRGL